MMSKQLIQRLILIIFTFVLVTACHHYTAQIVQVSQAEIVPTECKEIQHSFGESCIPLSPQRIIALDEITMEILLALDIKPIAATQPNITGSKIQKFAEKSEGVISLGKESQPNIEKMVQLNPDFILGFYLSADQYQLFSKIAPTVSLDYVQTGWKEALLQIGEITGKTAQAQKLLAQYQQRIQQFKAQINPQLKNKTISISRFYSGYQIPEFRTAFSFPGSILSELGLPFPQVQTQLTTNPDQTYISVNLERLNLLDADVLFVALDAEAQDSFQSYQKSLLWQTLDVVKNKQVYQVNSSYWIFGNILSAHAILDDLYKYLIDNS